MIDTERSLLEIMVFGNPVLTEKAKEIEDKLGLQSFNVFLTGKGDIKLDQIIVPKDKRKEGVGTQAMKELIAFADSVGKRIILSPAVKDDAHGTTSRVRLVKFYKQFGFIENKGRSKDFTIMEGMYRDPILMQAAKKAPSKKKKAIKTQVREVTGQVKDDELRDLRYAFVKAARASRQAYRAGKTIEAAQWKKKALDIALEARSKAERKKILGNLKNIKKKNLNSSISVEYKKKIDALLDGIDFTNLSDKKRKELESLAEYLEGSGAPLGIQPKYIKQLKRLSQTQPADMTNEDLKDLLATVKHLKALGKLKAKLLKFSFQQMPTLRV